MVKPADILVAAQKNSSHHQTKDPFRMALRIEQSQCGTPGTAEYQPTIDTKMMAYDFHIRQQVPACCCPQVRHVALTGHSHAGQTE